MSGGSQPRMPFGKHRGKPLCDLPDSYLLWLTNTNIKSKVLAQEIDLEMGYRQQQQRSHHQDRIHHKALSPSVVSSAENIIKRGYRILSLETHPDKGGDTSEQANLNLAIDFLRESIGSKR